MLLIRRIALVMRIFGVYSHYLITSKSCVGDAVCNSSISRWIGVLWSMHTYLINKYMAKELNYKIIDVEPSHCIEGVKSITK